MSETRLTDDIYDSEVNIKNYKLIRCDSHSRHTGGVAIYLKNKLNFAIVHNENFQNKVWILSVTVINKQIKGTYSVVYHAPGSDGLFLSFFDQWCDNNVKYDQSNVVCGDFNIDLLLQSDFYAKKMKQVIANTGMKQLIKDPTRITKASRTLIDYVLTNNFNVKANVLLSDKISDHSTILIDLVKRDTDIQIGMKIKKLVNYSSEVFKSDLLSVCWENMNQNHVDDKADFLTSHLTRCINQFVSVMPMNKNVHRWYTNELKIIKIEKDILYKVAAFTNLDLDWTAFKEISTNYSILIKETKSDYYKNRLFCARYDQKKTWKILKEIVNGEPDANPPSIDFFGEIITDSQIIPDRFNKYFIESVNDINESIPIENDCSSVTSMNTNVNVDFFVFQIVSITNIFQALRSIMSNGDCQFLNKNVLFDAMSVIGSQMLDVVNSSLASGIVPKNWKLSILCPIPKINGTMKCDEFRPINMLPTYEKILEAVVRNQLEEHLERHNIIIDQQSGFRKMHSCESALNLILMEWKSSIENGDATVAVFLDLKRAFETICRQRMIMKLERIGIAGKEKDWFISYLQERYQITKYNGISSKKMETKLGVPQGAKLAAVLFLIYINDINECLKYSKIGLFADDTLLYTTHKDPVVAAQQMNEDLANVQKWLNINKLKLNTEKTKCMVLNCKEIGNLPPIHIKNIEIERVKSIKYLGFIIDEKLKMADHVDYIAKKLAKKIGFLGRISNKMNLDGRLTIYKSIISPHFDYCASILYLCNFNEFDRLQKLQNRALRIVLRSRNRKSIKSMLNELNLLSVKQRTMMMTMVFIYKMKNKLLPGYLQNYISYVGQHHRYKLRNINNFRLPHVSRSSTQNCLFYKGLKQFNGLPVQLKDAKSLSEFKNLIKTYVKEKCKV